MNRVTRRLLPALAVVLVGGLLVPTATAAPKGGPKAPSSGVKTYTASASPGLVALPPASGATVQLTLANAAASTTGFGSAEISFVGQGRLTGAATVDRTGWSVTRSSADGASTTVLRLTNSGSGGQYEVAPGQLVVVTLPVSQGATAGSVTFDSQVKQSNDFSGTGNDFGQAGADPVVSFGHGPAAGLAWVTQPSSVQASAGAAAAATAQAAGDVTFMCPAPQVRVVDSLGNTVTSSTASVSLARATGSADAGLSGSTATAVAGVATFGNAGCSAGVSASTQGYGYTLTATSSGLTPTGASSPFDVLLVLRSCGETCSTGDLTGPEKTVASVVATGGAGDPDRLSVGFRAPWPQSFTDACDPDPNATSTTPNPFRDRVMVDLADHDKTVTLRWTKQAVQWATNNGAAKWQVCLAAEAPFSAVLSDGSVGETPLVDGWYVGALLPCGDDRLVATDPCLLSNGRNKGEQVAEVSIPDRPGDPRMY